MTVQFWNCIRNNKYFCPISLSKTTFWPTFWDLLPKYLNFCCCFRLHINQTSSSSRRCLSTLSTDQNNEKFLLCCHLHWRMRAKLGLAVQFSEYGVIISNTYKMEFSNLLSSRSKNLRRFLSSLCDFYSHQKFIFND